MNDTITEAAMWRVCYRLDVKGEQEIKQLRANLNIDPSVLSDAMRILERMQIIEHSDGKWKLGENSYGDIMKIAPRVQ